MNMMLQYIDHAQYGNICGIPSCVISFQFLRYSLRLSITYSTSPQPYIVGAQNMIQILTTQYKKYSISWGIYI